MLLSLMSKFCAGICSSFRVRISGSCLRIHLVPGGTEIFLGLSKTTVIFTPQTYSPTLFWLKFTHCVMEKETNTFDMDGILCTTSSRIWAWGRVIRCLFWVVDFCWALWDESRLYDVAAVTHGGPEKYSLCFCCVSFSLLLSYHVCMFCVCLQPTLTR